MRTSQKTLLIAVGSTLFGMALLTGIARAALAPYITDAKEDPVDANAQSTPLAELKKFDKISIRGASEIEIIQGEEWSVDISSEGNSRRLLVRQEDSTLILGRGKTGKGFHWGGWQDHEEYSAKVTMPTLKGLAISGHAAVDFSGFNGDKLNVEVSGAGELKGENSKFEDLEINVSGAGDIDFSDVKTINTIVKAAGAADIELNMDGGELSGHLSGIGEIRYEGEVSREAIKVSGVGDVEKL